MKYIITEKKNEEGFEVRVGGLFHADMHEIQMGKVVGAGHCCLKNGKYEVWGESIGYGIKSKPEDAKILDELLANPAKE